jgi:hypothetical protein
MKIKIKRFDGFAKMENENNNNNNINNNNFYYFDNDIKFIFSKNNE